MPELHGGNSGYNDGLDKRAAPPPTKPRPKAHSFGGNMSPPVVAKKPGKAPVATPEQPAVRNGTPGARPVVVSAHASPVSTAPDSPKKDHKVRPPPPARNQSLVPGGEEEPKPLPQKATAPPPARKPDAVVSSPAAAAKPPATAPRLDKQAPPPASRPSLEKRGLPEPVSVKPRPAVQQRVPPPTKAKVQAQPCTTGSTTGSTSSENVGQDNTVYNEIEDLISNFYDELETSDFFFKAQLENQ